MADILERAAYFMLGAVLAVVLMILSSHG